ANLSKLVRRSDSAAMTGSKRSAVSPSQVATPAISSIKHFFHILNTSTLMRKSFDDPIAHRHLHKNKPDNSKIELGKSRSSGH
ncbi:hypothetical protein L9F63_013510, partial [Diploptera punctata]